MTDTTHAACTACGHSNATDALRCAGCGAAGWVEVQALTMNLAAMIESACPITPEELVILQAAASPPAETTPAVSVPDFDAEAADMIEAAAESDGWIPPSHASNLADSIACLLQEVYERGKKIAAAGPAVEEIRRCVAQERAAVEADIAALRRMLADEQAAHEATRQHLAVVTADNVANSQARAKHFTAAANAAQAADAWQKLATERQQQYETEAAAHAETRQWSDKQHAELRTAYQELRAAAGVNKDWRLLADQARRDVANEEAAHQNTFTACAAHAAEAARANKRLHAALALLADIAKDTLAPAHAARYAALLAQEGQG